VTVAPCSCFIIGFNPRTVIATRLKTHGKKNCLLFDFEPGQTFVKDSLLILRLFRMNLISMKKIALVFLLILIASVASIAQTKLTVTIENIKGKKGSLRLGVFDSEEGFLKKAIGGRVIKPEGDKVTIVFDDLKPGKYAISIIHDENDNNEVDKKAFGIPKEGLGFSNNAMGKFGPPTFEDSSFTLDGQKEIVIKMLYL
jgi:uncharacterized protein (DUF2141 family)